MQCSLPNRARRERNASKTGDRRIASSLAAERNRLHGPFSATAAASRAEWSRALVAHVSLFSVGAMIPVLLLFQPGPASMDDDVWQERAQVEVAAWGNY